MFHSEKPDDDWNSVDGANNLLKEMKIDDPTERNQHSTQADHAEITANKSAALDARSGNLRVFLLEKTSTSH